MLTENKFPASIHYIFPLRYCKTPIECEQFQSSHYSYKFDLLSFAAYINVSMELLSIGVFFSRNAFDPMNRAYNIYFPELFELYRNKCM